ncbi:Major Facilitator Superfamily protein [Lentibacillus halodurans]|uniref:Major Facilitator Superfamily protein n=1 Tax=Lentibacillus halodurans TaxID=237679 RepID=A0A1I0XB31_9BACI|nr:MFS transporter [Lentibacillus halodurans]SFA97498.1 Major Facilitator Superfamily protein [Lentibacillus halodurans]
MQQSRKAFMTKWKMPLLLISGIGISRLGDFIYLVAINVLILQLTNSPVAVAGLWIMGPLASLLTKFWSGTLIDRLDQKKIMIYTIMIRAFFMAIIPFVSSISIIYGCLFLLSVGKAFFDPASVTYITKLIPREDRKAYNSYASLVMSSAFIVGPSIGGALLVISSANVTIWLTTGSFLISALIMLSLPNYTSERTSAFKWDTFKNDWKAVYQFSRSFPYIIRIVILVYALMVISMGMDAQEVVFIQETLGLSESDYGLLMSITGVGSITGAFILSVLSKKLTLRFLIGMGFLFIAIGYLIYGFSFSFWSVAAGFVMIGFFNSFSNSGFMTFFQNNVPGNMIGRIYGILGTLQSAFQIVFILLIGFTGEIIPLRYTIISASLLTFIISLVLLVMVMSASRKAYYMEASRRVSG